jgi:EmrB/QacA subfamily drug resistance transporter
MSLPLLRRASARRSPSHVPNPTIVLFVILAAYLMIVLDLSVVITALPSIQGDLGFSGESLSWVHNAYTLAFGGLLLLGARAGDVLGRRRVFLAGILLFTVASMAAGLAQSAAWLLTARVVQGIGAAIAAPSTLALLTTTFRAGEERTRALALYSAVVSAGGSAGLVLGGLLTNLISWRWGLFINVPVGATLLYLAPRHLPETPRRDHGFDLSGAATSTLGMSALVYGFVRAAEDGWADRGTLTAFASAIVLLIAFVAVERRAPQPITPLRLFASRERTGAYVARILMVGAMFSMFFFVTQYLQKVLHYDPLRAGIAFLPMTLVLFAMTRAVPRLTTTLGPRRMLIAGLAIDLVGMAWLSRLGATTGYFPGLALPLVLMGVGAGLAFVPLTAAGVAGVAEADAGAASGLVNAAHQLGGSVGVAVMVSVFAQAGGDLAHGIAAALSGSAIALALALAVVTLVMDPRRRVVRVPALGLGAAK